MNDIISGLERIARDGGRGVLAQVAQTEGCTPRKAGARMLLGPDGIFSGTVGGGVLEFYAERECRAVLGSGEPVSKRYSLAGSAARGEDIGAICGGSAVIDYTPIGPKEAKALLADMPRPPRVLLYGAGHVGKALADALHLLAIPVVVTDERDTVLTEDRFPYAERRLLPLGEAPMDPEPGDMIVIMTHGHAYDYALLRRAMDTGAGYIGVMASRVKAAAFRQRLAEEGVPAAAIEERLHCPIGLAIGAQTPEELAVSIAGELIAVLHGRG